AFALGFLVVWAIFEGIFYAILNFKVFKGTDIATQIMQFFPLESMSNLIIEPFSRLNAVQTAATQIGSELNKDYGIHWYQLLIVLVWIAFFVYSSLLLLRKRDL
ncbi:MAG: ABC transporter permease, partial [Gramella sp.]|nr:ABC transporter permease [Christiangramia sp.]